MSYDLAHIKVLIVDDMRSMLTLLKSILTTFGFEQIFMATNGEDAYEIVKDHNPDFIVTDWMMEPMDGLELTHKIRTDKNSPNPFVPIIMMTGFSSKIRVENARDSGMTEFLVKPFTAQDLYKRIFQIVEKPRQFVDAQSFFGPDRRRKKGDGYIGPRRRSKEETKTNKDIAFNEILQKLSDEAKKV